MEVRMEVSVKQIVSALAIAVLGFAQAAFGQTVVFENVTVIPMDGERVLGDA